MSSAAFTSCEVYRLRWGHNTTLVVIEIKTSDGKTGLGEASMSGNDASVMSEIEATFVRLVRDRHVGDVEDIIDHLGRVAAESKSLVLATAVSAIEQCLWDIFGQILNKPISSLIGDIKTTTIPLYANINRVPGERTPESFAGQAAAAIDAGFSAVKCAPFDEVVPFVSDGGDAVRPGMQRLKAIRVMIGSGVDLMVDCHGRLGVEQTLAIMDELSSLAIKWLEEPVVTNEEMWRVIRRRSPSVGWRSGTDFEGLCLVARAADLKIAGGEFEVGVSKFEELLSLEAIDIIMPDVKYCGGIKVAAEVSMAAAAKGIKVSPHNPSGPISTLGSAHVASISPTLDSLEIAWGELLPDQGLVEPALDIVRGNLRLPKEPGLGARLVPEAVARLRIAPDARL